MPKLAEATCFEFPNPGGLVIRLIVSLILLLWPSIAPATAQFPDVLIYHGERLSLFSNPLESYFGSEHPRPDRLFAASCSANWRGYVATWVVDRGDLYLTGLKDGSCAPAASSIPIEKLFPGRDAPVRAAWFSGVLRIPRGERLQYVHMGYGSTYERDLLLFFDAGRLVRRAVVFNGAIKSPASEKSPETGTEHKRPDSLIELPGAEKITCDIVDGRQRMIYSLQAEYPATDEIRTIRSRLEEMGWVQAFERDAHDHTKDWQPTGWEPFEDLSPGKPFSDIPKGEPVVVRAWSGAWVNAIGERTVLSLTYTNRRSRKPELSHLRVLMFYEQGYAAAEPLLQMDHDREDGR